MSPYSTPEPCARIADRPRAGAVKSPLWSVCTPSREVGEWSGRMLERGYFGESLNASFPVTLFPEDLEDWEEIVAELEARRSATWLDSGRTPSTRFEPRESGGLLVSVHDGPSTGITVTLPLSVLPPAWAAEQRDLLTRVREVHPREVAETSPGAYEWRRDRRS